MPALTSKRGIWYGVFTQNYKQEWIKIGRMSKAAAKGILRKLEEHRENKKFGITEEKLIPFEEFTVEYLEFSKANKAPQSHRRDKTSIQNLLRSLRGVYLPRMNSYFIEQFKIKRLGERVSPRTVNIELRCLSHMLNKAVEWGYIKESPFKGVKLFRYEKKPPRFLTKEEVSKLLEASSPWLKPILVVMLNTGIREGERKGLRFKDIDFTNKRIILRSPKTKDYRVIPMNEEAETTLKFLKDYYVPQFTNDPNKFYPRKESQKEYVFCNEDGTLVDGIKRSFMNACKKAVLTGVSPHTLRHTFASHLIMAGVDIRSVQRLLGHRDISTTMIYSHLTDDHLAKSVEKLSWVEKS